MTFWPNTYAYCKKVWFWFLNGLVLPGVFFTSQISTFIDWWTDQPVKFRHLLTGKPVNWSTPHISLHHVTLFEPITTAHFDQRYNNVTFIMAQSGCAYAGVLLRNWLADNHMVELCAGLWHYPELALLLRCSVFISLSFSNGSRGSSTEPRQWSQGWID